MGFDRNLLTFEEKRHRHLYDGKPLLGVTTILSVISKGDGLIQWGVNQAVEHIANNLKGELSQEDVWILLHEAKSAWKARRDEAADIGSQAHKWIESYLRGENPEWPENQAVRNSCEAAVKWIDRNAWTTRAIEKQIYHPKYGYAGICDWWAEINGELSVPDWKTSKGIYSTYWYQTAAYVKALEEETGERVESRWICRIDKVTGEFEAIRRPRKELAPDFKAFRAALDLYKREQELKKRAKE